MLNLIAHTGMKSSPPPFHVGHILRRVWRLLTPQERRRAGIMFLGIVVNSIVDILGLAAVVPVIGLVIQPDLIQSNPYLARTFEASQAVGIASERGFLMFLSVALVGAFLFKALFNLGLNLYQTRFSFAIGHRISGLMWQYHFSQSLERMRSTESGQILAEINGWPINLASNFIVGNLRFINELFVILVIAVGLVIYQPIVLLSVGTLITLGSLIIRKATKQRLDAYSEIQRVVGPQTGTLINSAVRGFLEVMSFRASDAIRSNYLAKTRLLFRINSHSQVMNMAPAKLYEVLAVSAVSAAIFISLWLQESNETFLNLLILMALSAYRIMPSMTRLNGHVMSMRSSYYVLNTIEAALQSWHQVQTSPHKEEQQWAAATVALQNVTLGYDALDEPVLTHLNATFEPGQIHAIVGPSGSGKSTLVNSILGLHPAKEGSISAGPSPDGLRRVGDDLGLNEWLAHVGYLSQQPFLFSGTVRENLTMRVEGAEVHEAQVERLVDALGLRDCLGENPLDFVLLEGGNNLSGGQQQRLAILRALRIERPVLILDEATSALDGAKRDAVFSLLKARARSGTNVLLITHDMDLASQCDTVLDLGAAVESPPQQNLIAHG
jgi:ABC-type multidrug transport system fused ATPase/permease subunit